MVAVEDSPAQIPSNPFPLMVLFVIVALEEETQIP
jgi:hypothetical protein